MYGTDHSLGNEYVYGTRDNAVGVENLKLKFAWSDAVRKVQSETGRITASVRYLISIAIADG